MLFTILVLLQACAAAFVGLRMIRGRSHAVAAPRIDGAVDALARQAQIALRSQGWQRFPEGAAIIARTSWTSADLLHALDRLFDAIAAEYKARGEGGNASSYLGFYDGGLRVIRDALIDGREPLH